MKQKFYDYIIILPVLILSNIVLAQDQSETTSKFPVLKGPYLGGRPRIAKNIGIQYKGEHKIRPYKGFRDGGRGEPCVHPLVLRQPPCVHPAKLRNCLPRKYLKVKFMADLYFPPTAMRSIGII